MTCIFHFPLCTSKGIKHPFENKNIGPCSPKQLGLPVSIIFSLSLLLFFRLIPWSIEALCNVNQGISASFSPLFSYLQYSFLISFKSCADTVFPSGSPGSCGGWTPAIEDIYVLGTELGQLRTMVFPRVMYGCEIWTVKKAEH